MALRRRVSSADQHRLDAYYAAVRTAEQELSEAGAWLKRPKPVVIEDQPTDIPDKADLIGRIGLLFNMVPLILETDSSRVVSIMIQDHGAVPKIEGVNGDHHNLSHHGQDEAKIAQLKKVESQIIGKLDGLLTQLRERGDNHGPLLDTTTVLFGSNLGNANSHEPKHLPILVAGWRLQAPQAPPSRGRPRRVAQQPLRHAAAGDGGRDGPVRSEQRHANLVVDRGTAGGGLPALSRGPWSWSGGSKCDPFS